MSQFLYQKSSRKNSRELFFAWIVGVIVFGGIALGLVYNDQGLFIAKIIAFILIPFTVGMLSASWYMLRANRDWEIKIVDGVLSWHAPSNLGVFTEESFSIELNEIDKVISKNPWPDSQTDFELEHSIALKNGTIINLSVNSGIPMSDLIEVLKSNGVSHETQII